MLTRAAPIDPIVRAELARGQAGAGRRRRFRRPGRVLLALAGVSAAVVLIYEGATLLMGVDLAAEAAPGSWSAGALLSLVGLFLLPLFVLVPTAVVLHFRLLLQTLVIGADALARERRAGTWEVLVLTGVDARRIVRGKWWGIVRRQARPLALLILLRIGATVWIALEASRHIIAIDAVTGALVYRVAPLLRFDAVEPAHLLAAAALIAVLTAANLGYTAATALLASAAVRRGSAGLVLAVVLRAVPLVALGVGGLVGANLLFDAGYARSAGFAEFMRSPLWGLYNTGTVTGLTLLDNGAVAAALVVRIEALTPIFRDGTHVYYAMFAPLFLAGALAVLLVYGLLGYAALRAAQAFAARQGALAWERRATP